MSAPATGGDGVATRSSGPGRLIIALYAVFGIGATSRAIFQILTRFEEAPLAYSLSAFAAVVYVIATVSLAIRSVTAWRVSLVAVLIELVGVLVVGTLTVFDAELFPDATVWSTYGRGYLFIPLVLPFIGLWWLRRTRPRG